jgi:hypothetical protein
LAAAAMSSFVIWACSDNSVERELRLPNEIAIPIMVVPW